jgi:pimeloyl-ACP methyl ester carboxylesterase
MERYLATVRADVSTPERSKFTAPLLLLHGFWAGGWMWEEVSSEMSQRGWECWALSLRGRPGSQTTASVGTIQLEDYVEEVVAAARALWAPPVVCGHSFGALLALLTATSIHPRALVLLAPLLPRAWSADARPPLPLAGISALPALLWNRPLRPPRWPVARDFLFNSLPLTLQTRLYERLRPDSGAVARAFTRGHLPAFGATLQCPVFLARGSEDRMCTPAMIHWLMTRFHAVLREYPYQGHWLTLSGQAAPLVTDFHRWLIRSLGESLLVPPEEEDL